ncbi:MAG TPA: hypothetical protein EYP59_18450 [Thiotrichaceae bacterium]|nr:hypothetical protein [Thiotrichaceae bacterium]
MNKDLILDNRTANDIYQQALYLAHKYCEVWVSGPKSKAAQKPSEDEGLVILKLFSFLTEYLLGQLNQIPNKYCVVFFDFIGQTSLPAKHATVPLTFQLAEDMTTPVRVPAETLGSTGLAEFETEKSLIVINTGLDTALLINPNTDQYADYSSLLTNGVSEVPNSQPLDHILYLVDDILFDIRRNPELFQIKMTGDNLEEKYFKNWFNKNDSIKTQVDFDPESNEIIVSFQELLIPNDTEISPDDFVTNEEYATEDNVPSGHWIGVRTELSSNTSLPSISSIKANLTVRNIIPGSALFNDTPLELKKGVFPFGDTPEAMDTLYMGSTEAFSKPDSSITITFDVKAIDFHNVGISKIELNWEFWDGNNWKIIATTGLRPEEDNNGNGGEEDTRGIANIPMPKTQKFGLPRPPGDDDDKPPEPKPKPEPFTDNVNYNFKDETEAFTISGDVTFTCPPIVKTKINEIENWWIRVIIISGGYGTVGEYIETTSVDEVFCLGKKIYLMRLLRILLMT